MAKYDNPVEVHAVILCLYKWLWAGGDRLRRFQIRVSDNPISYDDIFTGKTDKLNYFVLQDNYLITSLYYRGVCVLVQP